jgi:predicted HicB family RNase H-like nuclease
MSYGETTEGGLIVLKQWVEKYGIPKSIYVDLKTVYISPKTYRMTEAEKEEAEKAFTHFSRACNKLGIEVIKAYSAQAKGRVERNHRVYHSSYAEA